MRMFPFVFLYLVKFGENFWEFVFLFGQNLVNFGEILDFFRLVKIVAKQCEKMERTQRAQRTLIKEKVFKSKQRSLFKHLN